MTNILQDYPSDPGIQILVSSKPVDSPQILSPFMSGIFTSWTFLRSAVLILGKMQVMECVSTWPLLQRNKIEDSKINIALQAIADVPLPEDDMPVTDGAVKPEDAPETQEVKAEPLEPANPGLIEGDVDWPQSAVKSENTESADLAVSTDPANDAMPMTIDEPNLESGRGRTTERHESQAVKLKRLATKVFIPRLV